MILWEILVFSDYEKNEAKVPVLSYGLDLKYWGKNDVKPAEVPRNNADCHRFWRPSDERLLNIDFLQFFMLITSAFAHQKIYSSSATNLDIAEAYHSRVMIYVGQQLKGSRQCRVPLTNGVLCPRMDLKRCPLHGKIIDRDEMGFPVNEIIQYVIKKVKVTNKKNFI